MSSLSREPARNVAAKELATRYVENGNHMRYDFPENSTCIMYIEYDATRTFLKTTTTVEELKNRSTFVSKLPSGRIYKHVNIRVGDKRGGLPTSLKNGSVGFRIEKAWINDNKISESLITLQWYNNSWEPLPTEKVGEDDNYLYFKSGTPGFSFFAITEYTGETLRSPDIADNISINGSTNGSTKISKAKEAREAAKLLMAIILPLFLIFAGYLVFKKKI